MSIYTADAAEAYADILEEGAAVTFTKTDPGTQDATTGLYTGATTVTVEGAAMGTEANIREYERLSLVPRDSRTLLFAPATHGEEPALDSTLTWGGATYTLKSFLPFDPDGLSLISYAIVTR
jgi:hypothetical protein